MKQIKTLKQEIESQVSDKVGKGEFEIVEFKRSNSVIIDVEGIRLQVMLNPHKKEVTQLTPEKQNITLSLSTEQSQAVFEKLFKEVETKEYERLKAKLGK